MNPPERLPFAEWPASTLCAKGAEYRRMAGTARSQEVMAALLRLAKRFEGLADQRKQKAGAAPSPPCWSS